ncbi:hypothetical protein AGDE_16048 [Angomonas deanei]|uniref:Uncharacterized protein n=1 Tax=Angomonas deanei TaxID=59799 RepID=A0A7G2CIS9_9TRYP|nr:hypothetical protein AGDE_16048 [Angomonas deanei]CAD2218162.1 hypothetical protein, conserved [Angomonas deanei]|eukprot:EPY17842.1 hypothetical protein AGDE_16048 [Angomonas deanei]
MPGPYILPYMLSPYRLPRLLLRRMLPDRDAFRCPPRRPEAYKLLFTLLVLLLLLERLKLLLSCSPRMWEMILIF